MKIPKTRYARAPDGTSLAYQVFGEGDVDLLYVSGWLSHLEVFWELPQFASFMRHLGTLARVVTFDKRGVGLSDRAVRLPDLETMMGDVRTVLDAIGSKRSILFGLSTVGGGPCAVYAASFPERTLAFVWWEAGARVAWAPDYPWGLTEEDQAQSEALYAGGWGDEQSGADVLRDCGCLSIADVPNARDWVSKLSRYSAGPAGVRELNEMWQATDVRGVLSSIHVPTLVTTRYANGEAA